LLPERWHGTFLMAPFTNTQLMLADITSDGKMMRATLHGISRGSLDLFVKGDTTYVLSNNDNSRACVALGDTGLRPLSRDWLTAQSQCTGAAPLGNTVVDGWKTPVAPKPATDWVWFKTSDRSPFRLVFQSESDRLSILSRYAMSYQIRFASAPDAD